jgi:hypothetical protein
MRIPIWIGNRTSLQAASRFGEVQAHPRIQRRSPHSRETFVKRRHRGLTLLRIISNFTPMDNLNFDELLSSYKQAVDRWVDAIRAEESLATPDHSMVQMEKWDDAGFTLHDAELTAKKARDAYKNALRKKNYGF